MVLPKATRKQADPLAGMRQAINERELEHLVWPDYGQGSPVKRGEIFRLRTCHIEITQVRRTRSAGNWIWFANFVRSYPEERLWLLDKKGGYTVDPNLAIRAQDDPSAATLDSPIPQERTDREPPEPEGVPPHEIGISQFDQQARVRREGELARRRVEFSEQPVEIQLLQLRRLAKECHVDISSEQRVIERRIAAIRRRLLGDVRTDAA